MKLIIGLGNPEKRYEKTRHNLGFLSVDTFCAHHNYSFASKDKFQALIAEHTVAGEKVIIAKPTTYYNLSGEAVRAIADFYKIDPQDILIVHDELALPFGVIRTRIGGSAAGNNGVKSVTQHMGEGTARVRIGIMTAHGEQQDAADFVLGRLSADETEQLPLLTQKVCELIAEFVAGNFAHSTHK
jgi:PTH1 family peptidyl-tRNA hydrolase